MAAAPFVLPSVGQAYSATARSGRVSPRTSDDAAPLTVVLVHGAFADASSWTGVIQRLQHSGIQVTAPANPLRGISIDTAYLASLLGQIPGPVLAVGHSYAGALISNAASIATNVVGLVFVAAFAPDEGERLGDLASSSKDSILGTAQLAFRYPTGPDGQTATEFGVDPAKFHAVFAADLPADQAAVLAATQRPVSELAFSQPNTAPAWKNLPSWAVVATDDKAAGADITRTLAQRAGATITEITGSHLVLISQPEAVADVILSAVAAVGQPSAAGVARVA
ncbi:MAG: alpha/beta hydrolase [Chloroflexi bacterium]|nr:alpha/beta hydrolase [Chloroflexota bacterium]